VGFLKMKMKTFFKILFFFLAIFQTDICNAKVAVIDYVVSEISLSNIFNSEKNCYSFCR